MLDVRRISFLKGQIFFFAQVALSVIVLMLDPGRIRNCLPCFLKRSIFFLDIALRMQFITLHRNVFVMVRNPGCTRNSLICSLKGQVCFYFLLEDRTNWGSFLNFFFFPFDGSRLEYNISYTTTST